MEYARWLTLMAAFSFAENKDTYEKLCAGYAEPHRHYHNQSHVNACLRHLDRCKTLAEYPAEVELALWFHDAVYEPFRKDNEHVSADWAARFMAENGAVEDSVARVHRLIMVTEHDAPTQSVDESLLVDIDLSILGVPAADYAVFEANVRKEYRRVPLFLYKKKRAAVLQGFLERPVIYQNEPFYSQLEATARNNLQAAIERLVA